MSGLFISISTETYRLLQIASEEKACSIENLAAFAVEEAALGYARDCGWGAANTARDGNKK